MKPWAVALVDLVWVLVFAAVGRVSHGESLNPAGLASTAGPFVAGWLVGWLLVLAIPAVRRRPQALVAGVVVWVPTVVLGMALRVATGSGVQVSFVIVAAAVLAIFLLGWRGVVKIVRRGRDRELAGSRP